jgi:hypothetical protein
MICPSTTMLLKTMLYFPTSFLGFQPGPTSLQLRTATQNAANTMSTHPRIVPVCDVILQCPIKIPIVSSGTIGKSISAVNHIYRVTNPNQRDVDPTTFKGGTLIQLIGLMTKDRF